MEKGTGMKRYRSVKLDSDLQQQFSEYDETAEFEEMEELDMSEDMDEFDDLAALDGEDMSDEEIAADFAEDEE